MSNYYSKKILRNLTVIAESTKQTNETHHNLEMNFTIIYKNPHFLRDGDWNQQDLV